MALAASAAPPLSAAEPELRRVLIINSFGNRFAPFDLFTSTMRSEIARGRGGPVEFLEAPLEMARFAEPAEEAAFAGYVRALTADRGLDLVLTVGGPAASFAIRHRESLFASVPILITGLDERLARDLPPAPGQIVVAIRLEPTAILENMQRVLPGTTRVAVVVGDSPLERFWRAELEREFAPFAGPLTFTWLNRLSLDGMRSAVAALPRGSAVFYGGLYVDAAGVPHEGGKGLPALRSATRAPIFGVFESQLGKGIVGGPLVSVEAEGRRSAAVALRLLAGEAPADVRIPPRVPVRDIYDWRELDRWGIEEARLPPGSEIRHRPPSVWEAYRRQALTALAVVAVEAALIAGLLAQRARRRRAEERVRALNRRLITAQEEERKSIARELHDDLSQRLARLSIDASRLGRGSPGAEPVAAAEIQAELTRLSGDVHALAYRLHPSTLDDLGLTEALRIECERASRLESIPVDLRAPEDGLELSRDGRLCLFRIAQEGLRNVVRHARASSVEVSLENAGGGVRLTIRDDGAGFDSSGGRNGNGLGLASMRERVELIGGKIDIRSAPGRGTTIDVWAPLGAERS
jgi:signal transduction histidine kinase